MGGDDCWLTGTSPILTSADGVTWTAQTPPPTVHLQSVVWSGTQLIAVGDSGTIFASADGQTWSVRHGGTPRPRA